MASSDDNSQVDIGVVLDDATLNSGLQRTAREIQEAVRAARALQEQFAGTVRTVEPLLASLTRLRTELATTPRDQLRQAEADLRAATAALTAARQAASAPTPTPASGSGAGAGSGSAGGSGSNLPPNPGSVPGAGGGGAGGLFGFQAQIGNRGRFPGG